MAESTLNLTYTDLKGAIGDFLGYGRGADFGEPAWTSKKARDVEDAVRSGVRQFYFPPALEGESDAYDWSFLKPTATLSFPQSSDTVRLPDDFGGVEGNLTIQTSSTTSQPWRIEWRNEGEVRRMYSVTPSQTGPPMYASQQPIKGTAVTQSQRFQLLIFPLADQDYTLQLSYYLNPDCLSGAFPYTYGGPQHAETILESCKMMAELARNDARGVHAIQFQERLRASIAMDRKNKPQKLGTNRDLSDELGWNRSSVHYAAAAATYNGSAF